MVSLMYVVHYLYGVDEPYIVGISSKPSADSCWGRRDNVVQ